MATLSLADNGWGFEPEELASLPTGRQGSYGQQGRGEHLTLLGGRVQIRSKPGEGTCVSASVPRLPLMTSGMASARPGREEAYERAVAAAGRCGTGAGGR